MTGKKKKKNLSSKIIRIVFYPFLFILLFFILFLFHFEEEEKIKNPYEESLRLKTVIDDILGKNGVPRIAVTETSEEKILYNQKVVYLSYNIIFVSEGEYQKLCDEITETLKKDWAIFSKSDYELNGQKTTTYYIGFEKYITCFIAVSYYDKSEQTQRHPVIAIIIDDLGLDRGPRLETLLKLKGLTFSVLPGLKYTDYTVKKALDSGHEVMLHCPMEPINPDLIPKNETRMLITGMKKEELKKILVKNLESIPEAVGINNHMGSKFTQEEGDVRVVMEVLKARNLYYVDSLTIQSSKAWQTADKMGIPYLRRDIFLDHENSKKAIKKQISKLIRLSFKRGYAVAIGHIRGVTPETLEEAYDEFKVLGIEVVPVSYIIKNREKLSKNGDIMLTGEMEEIINEYLDQ